MIGVGTSATSQYAAGPVGAGDGEGLAVGAGVGELVGVAVAATVVVGAKVGEAVALEATDWEGVGDGVTAAPPHADAIQSAMKSARAWRTEA